MTTIRPRVSLIAGLGAAAVTLIAIFPAIFDGAWTQLPELLCTLAIIDIAVWLLFVHPSIQFDENRVVVTNPIRILSADWGAIDGFETKYGLTFVAGSKKFVAWAAPAPSRRDIRRIDRHDLKGTELENRAVIEPGQLRGFDSGNAYWQLEDLRENAAKSAAVKIRTNWLTLAGILVIALLAYVDLHF